MNILDKINKKGSTDLLYKKYNDTDKNFDIKNLSEAFTLSAGKYSKNIAIIEGENKITYEELDKRSNRVANFILKNCNIDSKLVGIFVPRKISTIVNVLGIIKAGCAYIPIDPEYPHERIEYIKKNSECSIVLDEDFYESNKIEEYSDEKVKVDIKLDDLAYIIYTSGSTGVPKGVKTTHEGAYNTILDINKKFNVNESDRIIALSSMCFDLSVYDIFGALFSGASLVQIKDQRDIKNIMSIIEEHKISIWNSIPSTMEMLVDNVKKEWQNDSLRLVLLSGDWISLKLPDKIKQHFKNSQCISLGGATEASIWSIYYKIDEVKDEWKSIPYGMPLANQKIYVLNYQNKLCPPGVEGEICIGGIGVAKGYMNNKEKTDKAFVNIDSLGYIYRTGDYGVFNKQGYVEFIGRKDNQVKIRGYRVELGEVESAMNSCEGINKAVVTAKKDSIGNSYLCGYYVAEGDITLESIREKLNEFLPKYMVPSKFVKLDVMPLTYNGKIDRKNLPEPKDIIEAETNYVEATDSVEKKLIEIYEEVFNNDIKLGTKDNFFEIGINSILMVKIITKIEEELNISVKFKEYLKQNNISELASYVKECLPDAENRKIKEYTTDLKNINEPFPISDVQIAYLMGRDKAFELGGTSTHAYAEIESKYDIERFNRSLNKVIERHPVLRSIILPNGTQKILEDVPKYKIEVEDYSGLSQDELNKYILEEREKLYHHVFETDQWPLFKFKAFKTPQNTYYLFIEYDLMIGDGMSMRILTRELVHYYEKYEEELQDINYNFRDYMLSYQDFKKSEIYLNAKKYWQDKIAAFPQAPKLPYKADATKIEKPHFARIAQTLNKDKLKSLRKRAKENNVTISALLCTAFSEVLAYWSNQPHHAVNLTVFNRYPFNKDVERIIGDFTSSLLLDVDVSGNKSFWDKCKNVQDVLMEALENRHYNGIEFIRDIAKYNHMENTAIMPIVFTSMVFDDRDESRDETDKIGETRFEGSQTSQVFLDFQVSDSNGVLKMSWDYVEQLFDKNMINQMFSQYIGILLNIAEGNNDYRFELNSDDSKLVETYNDTCKYVPNGLLHEKIYQQAEEAGDNTAIKFKNHVMTYNELNYKSNQVARMLIKKGVKKNDFVALYGKRCPNTIVNILGILKAGAAYVPIDPAYPENRVKFICDTCNAKYYLKDEYEEDIEKYSKDNLEIINDPEDLAYVIFTSGSTGRPKGVMITHNAAYNTIYDINKKFNVNSEDKILAVSSMCFDLSVYDIFGSLLSGGQLIQVEDQRDVNNLVKVIEEEGVTICNSVPSIMEMIVENLEDKKIDSLRLSLLSGDWISLNLPEKMKNNFKNVEVVSLGGATEASIWSIYYRIKSIEDNWTSIPYGMPLANQKFYVMNYKNEICPVGVAGELYIGGKGVAAGYLSDDEKNAETFINTSKYGRLYKTGDYGILQKEGYITFLGRKDNQVKIRGFRIELGEIERSLMKIDSIENAVVTDYVDSNNKKNLAAYIVSSKDIEKSTLSKELSKYVPKYMIPNTFIKIDEMPLTANGKIDREQLPKPCATNEERTEYVAPRSNLEKQIQDIWQDVLKVDNIGIKDNFYDLGGQSILMIRIIAIIEKKLYAKVLYSEFINNPTIEELADLVKSKDKSSVFEYNQAVINKEDLYKPFKLTDVQMAYLLGRDDSFELGGVSTHLYTELETEHDISRLSKGLQKVIEYHPMMRAVVNKDGKQMILENVPKYEIKVEDVSNLDEEVVKNKILSKRKVLQNHIFDTDKWPLFSFEAFKLKNNKYYLFIEFDQLIADGMSIQIITKDLMEFYNNPNKELEEIEFSFRDYIVEYNNFKKTERYKMDKEYWMSKIEDFAPAPALPVIKGNMKNKNHSVKRCTKVFSEEQWSKLKNVARSMNVSPSALLCSMYTKVLSVWSNQERLSINLTVFNRYPFHEDVNKIVGDFTSVVLLDVDTKNKKDHKELSRYVQKVLAESLEHRHYDGVEFIRELGRYNNATNKPLMPVVFTSMLFGEMDGINSEVYKEIGERKFVATQTSQVYLDSQVSDSNGMLTLTWDYMEDLFEDNFINNMFEDFVASITNVINGNYNYSILLNDEDKKIIDNYNSTDKIIEDTDLVSEFNKIVQNKGENIAIIDGDNKFTYKDIDRKSNRIANYLLDNGVKEQDCIALVCHRTYETYCAILGILKTGAAYVPVDVEYPKDRIDYIVSKSKAKMLIKVDEIKEQVKDCLDVIKEKVSIKPLSTAYIIFTSGSTGKPKGVKINHKAVLNTIFDINKRFNITEKDRIIAISSMCFDLSVYDIFGTFLSGAAMVVVQNQRDSKEILRLVKKNKVTVWNSVPEIMNMAVEYLGNNKNIYSWNDREDEEYIEDEEVEIKRLYTWSPIVQWRIGDDYVVIGDKKYSEKGYLDVLPQLYYFCQNEVSLEQIKKEFSGVENIESIINELIDSNVLINHLVKLEDLFASQDNLLKHNYGTDLIFNKEAYNKFKKKQLNRSRKFKDNTNIIELNNNVKLPSEMLERRSCREFNKDQKISFNTFSLMLAAFKQRQLDNGYKVYNYASAGGLYPIDVYIYVKEGRVENVERGLYYYNPIKNDLVLIDNKNEITSDAHYFTNKKIFKGSAFSVYFIYNANVTMPRYSGAGYLYSLIDTGIMVSTLSQISTKLNIGLCSIGDMNFDRIKPYFKLNDNEMFIHEVEGGIKAEYSEVAISSEDGKEEITNELSLKEYDSLRLVLLSGDWIPLSLPENIKKSFSNAKVVSLGGATEASIWSIFYEVNEVKNSWRSIPYGMPLSNQKIYVLSQDRNILPINIPGEIYIGGIGLADGYANDIDKTNVTFIEDEKLGRIYKTGDYGVMRKDSYVEFLGRKDNQVKVNGFRVELEEIENCMSKYSRIKQCAVTVQGENKQHICAYYVSDNSIDIDDLKDYMKKSLTNYMIPRYFVSLNNMPLTSNGKINKKLLPKAQIYKQNRDNYVEALTKEDKEICNLISEVLGLPKISVEDDFFELGGDSLKAMKLISVLDKKFNIDSNYYLFSNSKIQDIINYINAERKKVEIKGCELIRKGTVVDKNIFVFPDVVGNINQYIELISKLNKEYNCYALTTDWFKGIPVEITLEELAERYVKTILKIQKHGEYILTGWSFGGIMSYEVARQLLNKGMKVKNLNILDTLQPGTGGEYKFDFSIETEKAIVAKYINKDLKTDDIKNLKMLWNTVIKYFKNNKEEFEKFTHSFGDLSFLIQTDDVDEAIRKFNLFRTVSRAEGKYNINEMIDSNVVLVRAQKSFINMNLKKWAGYFVKVSTYEFDTDHVGLLTGDNVNKLSDILNKYL